MIIYRNPQKYAKRCFHDGSSEIYLTCIGQAQNFDLETHHVSERLIYEYLWAMASIAMLPEAMFDHLTFLFFTNSDVILPEFGKNSFSAQGSIGSERETIWRYFQGANFTEEETGRQAQARLGVWDELPK